MKSLANEATDKSGQEIGSLNGIFGDVVSALGSIMRAINNVSQYVTLTAAAIEEQSTLTSETSQQHAARCGGSNRDLGAGLGIGCCPVVKRTASSTADLLSVGLRH